MAQAARILVVDDDPDMLHLISLRLSAAGYQVSAADSGEAALLSFREQRPQMSSSSPPTAPSRTR